jgi:hypothetical protein
MVIASTLHSVSFKRIFEWVPPEYISRALSKKATLADLSTWAVEFLLEKRAEKRE